MSVIGNGGMTLIREGSASVPMMWKSIARPGWSRNGGCGCSRVCSRSRLEDEALNDSQSVRTGGTSCPRLSKARGSYRNCAFPAFPFQNESITNSLGSLTLAHTSKICDAAFPPGKHFRLHPGGPDVERVNRRGGFDLAADRLAFMYVPLRIKIFVC